MTAVVVLAISLSVLVLVSHLPRQMTRRERMLAEQAHLREHLDDLRAEHGETCARLGEIRSELEDEA